MRTLKIAFVSGFVLVAGVIGEGLAQGSETPFLPGGQWRVQDSRRPVPVEVEPGAASTQDQPGKPPSDAIILFDGKDSSQWQHVKGGVTNAARWKVVDGALEVVPKSGDLVTKEGFGSCQLHIEWRTPAEAKGTGQGKSNSGVFLMGRYEIQMLDNYKNPTYADGYAGSVYGQFPPLVNPLRPSGAWQVYDIIFEAPAFQDGKVAKPATVTVLINGVLVQNHTTLFGPTVFRTVSPYQAHSDKEPLLLQDHGNPIRFRNIWIRPLK